MSFSFFKRLATSAFVLMATSAHAQTVTPIPTEGDVTAVVQTPRGSYIETTRGTFRLEIGDCDDAICVIPDVIRGLPEQAPEGALPDGKIATAETGDIRKAWYARPTDRYQHCVLGDCIEGGSLVVELADGTQTEFVLPDNQVFEDITPRLADLDGDGGIEVITLRASQRGGGAVVVYGLRDGQLVEVVASEENGRTNRWLNIAAIIDDTIHFVRTPHIGGRWSTLTYTGESAQRRDDIRRGVSNHLIGDRELDLAEVYEADGATSLFIPAQNRRSLVDVLDQRDDIALPAPIDKAIIGLDDVLITATQNGQLLAIKP